MTKQSRFDKKLTVLAHFETYTNSEGQHLPRRVMPASLAVTAHAQLRTIKILVLELAHEGVISKTDDDTYVFVSRHGLTKGYSKLDHSVPHHIEVPLAERPKLSPSEKRALYHAWPYLDGRLLDYTAICDTHPTCTPQSLAVYLYSLSKKGWLRKMARATFQHLLTPAMVDDILTTHKPKPVKTVAIPPLPASPAVLEEPFIRPPTREQLMGGGRARYKPRG